MANYGAFIAMLKRNDSTLLESLKPTDQELWALSIDFAAGYKHLNVMCFYEKVPAKYAGGLVKVEVDIALNLSIALKQEYRLYNKSRLYVKEAI